jgi:hypothetical protein
MAFVSWFAYAGADFFFVISGVIVSQAAIRTARTTPRVYASLGFAPPADLPHFPLHWIAMAVAIAFGG